MIEQIIHQIWLQDSHNFNIQTNLDNKTNIIKNSSAPNDLKELMIETVKINQNLIIFYGVKIILKV